MSGQAPKHKKKQGQGVICFPVAGGGAGAAGGGGGGGGAGGDADIPDWAKRAGPSAAFVVEVTEKLNKTFPAAKGAGKKPLDRGPEGQTRPFPFSSMLVEPRAAVTHYFTGAFLRRGKIFAPFEPFCIRSVFVWCPTMAFPSVFSLDRLKCPSCTTAHHVVFKGWAPCVKVTDIDDYIIMTSQRCVA
jgi:hypothetical protein